MQKKRKGSNGERDVQTHFFVGSEMFFSKNDRLSQFAGTVLGAESEPGKKASVVNGRRGILLPDRLETPRVRRENE